MEIKVRIEGGDRVMRDLHHAPDAIKKKSRLIVRAASFALEKRIKREMPVDTGRARAGWGHWSPFAVGTRKHHRSIRNKEASSEDAIWEELDDGLTIVQGTNIPYVQELNEGSSKQAPRGFIEKAVGVSQRALTREVGRMLDEVFK